MNDRARSSLWMGAIIFSGFMKMLLNNQRHSLEAIDAEIKKLKNKLTYEHAALVIS